MDELQFSPECTLTTCWRSLGWSDFAFEVCFKLFKQASLQLSLLLIVHSFITFTFEKPSAVVSGNTEVIKTLRQDVDLGSGRVYGVRQTPPLNVS